MTEVDFHTGVAEPVAYACRLLRKAVRRGVRVQVTAPPELLVLLDRALWTFEPGEFVPHVRMPGADAERARRTPVWLCATACEEDGPDILLNLGAPVPPRLTPFKRVIELISSDPDQAAHGRRRWRHYQSLGLPLKHHLPPDATST